MKERFEIVKSTAIYRILDYNVTVKLMSILDTPSIDVIGSCHLSQEGSG